MQLSDVVTIAVGLVSILVTASLWLRVTHRVRTEEHPVIRVSAQRT